MLGEVLQLITETPKVSLYVFFITLFSTYYIILKYRRDSRLVKFSKSIPGPTGFPLIGNALPFVFSGLSDANKVLLQYSEKYGKVYKLWLGNELVIGISNVDFLEAVFRSTKILSKPKILFDGYKQQYGNSLFTTSVLIWKQTRKRLQPIFGKNVMKSQISQIQKYVDKYVCLMEKHVDGKEFNVKNYMEGLAINTFLGIYYNLHLTTKEQEYFKFNDIFDNSNKYGFGKIIFPWLRVHRISKLYFGNQKEMQDTKLREFFNLLKFTEPAESVDDVDDEGEKLSKKFLSTIQDLERDMKIEDYAFNEATNFIVAAAGTTTTALSFCLLAIAMHSDIQNKLYNELKSILGDDDRGANIDELSRFVYLDQVVKESSRRFTLLRSIFREAEEDIKIGSLIVPAGTTVFVRVADVHMNPELYPNPQEFNPENFSAAAISKRSKYSFLPFSLGIRDCIGKYLADSMTKLMIISLLRKYKISTSIEMKDIDYTGAFTVKKSGEYSIRIESR